MRKVILIGCLLSGMAFAQNTAPFGIPMGTTISQILKMGAVYNEKNDVYILKTPPVKNSSFETYLVLASKKAGVCKIVAVGKDINTSSDGFSLKSEVESFKKLLASKYGEPTDSFDFLKSGSIWDRTQDFMMGLRSEDRYLDYYWQVSKGAKIGNNVSTINLGGRASSSTVGHIVVGYEYKNMDVCKAEADEKDSSGL